MSWVLILTPTHNYRIDGAAPAIIGGYNSKDEANRAGEIAIDYWGGDDLRRKEWYEANPHGGALPKRDWDSFIVIPGAADTSPEQR